MSQLWVSLRLAVASLLRNKTRSLLTSLGILIGIAAVAIVIALGEGARSRIDDQIDSLGSNLVYVFGQSRSRSGARGAIGARVELTDDDARAIENQVVGVTMATVYSSVKVRATTSYFNETIDAVGADTNYLAARSYSLADGRTWTTAEESSKARVCLIGATAATNLFGNHAPVGQTLRIGRHPYRIIGLLAPKGVSPFGRDQDNRVIMPIGAWRARVSPTPGKRVQIVMASVSNEAVASRVQRDVGELLAQRRGLSGEEPPFRVRSQDQFQRTRDRVQGVLSLLLLSVASIALFVGGVGVMNIMLVSINERQREIGIRMAIGARPTDIHQQFLIEALVLTLFGGLLGVLLAFGLVRFLAQGLGWPMQLSPAAVLTALVISLLVGILFGFLPARRAASLDPIEALRYE